MIKSVFAATAALSMSAGAALAGPYVNVEANASWAGDDYAGATTDLHVGYEGAIGDTGASYYVRVDQQSLLLTVLRTALASLVKQALASLSPMHSVHMVNSPSSLQKTSSWMISA